MYASVERFSVSRLPHNEQSGSIEKKDASGPNNFYGNFQKSYDNSLDLCGIKTLLSCKEWLFIA